MCKFPTEVSGNSSSDSSVRFNMFSLKPSSQSSLAWVLVCKAKFHAHIKHQAIWEFCIFVHLRYLLVDNRQYKIFLTKQQQASPNFNLMLIFCEYHFCFFCFVIYLKFQILQGFVRYIFYSCFPVAL
jgi:hypothetical protein